MRRAVVLVALMGVTLVLAGGIALAATFIRCTDDFCLGTSGPDDICGTPSGDVIYGRGGFDVILGDGGAPDGKWGAPGGNCRSRFQGDPGGDDVIHGDSGPDGIYDEAGNDVVIGGDGDDSINFPSVLGLPWSGIEIDDLRETNGNDIVFGGNGNDSIATAGGTDVVISGRGNDYIYARDGDQDTLFCGEGKDTVYYNRDVDKVVDCEIRRPSSAASKLDHPAKWGPGGFRRLR